MVGIAGLFAIVCCAWQEPAIEVQSLQGSNVERGVWQGLDVDQLRLKTPAGDRSIAIAELRTIQFGQRPNSIGQSPDLRIQLTDGTNLRVNQVVTESAKIKLSIPPATTFEVEPAQIRYLQFQGLNEKQHTQWRAIVESRIADDTLVIARSAESIDKIEGQILEITPQKVVFQFNKQKIDAPLTKLIGLRFFSPPAKTQRVTANITDVIGNNFQVAEFGSSTSTSLNFTLSCGAKLALPIDQLAQIDFSSGSIVYLADLKPLNFERSNVTSFKTNIVGAEQLFAPQRMTLPASNNPSLKMTGSGVITYRLPEACSKFMGQVFLAPPGEQFTACQVAIKLENQTLWEGKLNSPVDRLDFSLEVQPDQRLQLIVKAMANYPVGDVVVWQEPRVIK